MVVLEQIKRHKIIASAIVVAAIGILFLAISASGGSSNAAQLVSDFEKAVNEGNTGKLQKMIEPENSKMAVSESNYKQLVAYLKGHPDRLQEVVLFLRAQAAIVEKDAQARMQLPMILQVASDQEIMNYGDFYIKKTNGIFSSYKLYARPYYLTIKVQEPDTVVEVSGKKLFTSANGKLEYTYGPLMPGTYTVLGTKKYNYADIKSKYEADLFGEKDRNSTITLEVGKKINIVSTIDNVSILINGKAVEGKAVKVENVQSLTSAQRELTFGPVSTDGSMTVQGEVKYPWGTVKSEPQTITGQNEMINITPNPFGTAEVRDKVTKTINGFAQQSIEALVKHDPSVIKNANENVMKKFVEQINYEKDVKFYWKGKALGTRIDYSKVSITSVDGIYYATVPVEFHNQQRRYGGAIDTDAGKPVEETFDKEDITLYFDSKTNTWIISDNNTAYFNTEDMKGQNVVKTEFK